MEVLILNCEELITYPVGLYPDDAMKFINLVVPKLNSVIKPTDKLNLWVRGSSGAILASFLCSKIQNNCKIMYIRKPGEFSHSIYPVRDLSYNVNIIIDDFICSGETVNTIYKEMSNYNLKQVDIFIIDSYTNKEWKLDFIPKILITGKDTKFGIFNLNFES